MNNFIDFIIGVSIWTVIKVFVIIALFIYAFFALVIAKQVGLMTKVISGKLDLPIKIISWLHLFFSLFVIILALIIL